MEMAATQPSSANAHFMYADFHLLLLNQLTQPRQHPTLPIVIWGMH
jgi:hypothetical protein